MSSIHTATDTLYALVDCNNFYVSCERVFDPQIRKQPVIVLSNNDGCAIARSEEAKAAGVEMGVAVFKIRDLIRKHNIRMFSSNYVLYGDMSARVMAVLRTFTPNMEIYSIDEAFLCFRGFTHTNMLTYANTIRDAVYQQTGLPVSVGIGRTKTLAKIANHIAKKKLRTGAFCLLSDEDDYLRSVSVTDIWGIGRKRQEWLYMRGVTNAYELKQMPDRLIKKKMTVTGLRTVWELRGIPCLALEEVSADKKAIACSRMFGNPVSHRHAMEEAVSAYVARACVKLRRQNLLAGYIHVIVETNRFRGPYYHNALGMYVNPPTADTARLIRYGQMLLNEIYLDGYKYNRAGVVLTDLISQNNRQEYFITPVYTDSRREKLMEVIDRYNSGVNCGKIQFAAEGLGKPWHMRQALKSNRFTTNWNELLTVNL